MAAEKLEEEEEGNERMRRGNKIEKVQGRARTHLHTAVKSRHEI